MKSLPIILAASALTALTGATASAQRARTESGSVPVVLAAPLPARLSSPACSAACQPLPLLEVNALTINGSTTVRPITERAETFFQQTVKNASFTVLAPGSGAGRRALLEGQCARVGGFPSCDLNGDGKVDPPCDIAASSSKMPASELTFAASHGCCLAEYSVALDGLGIIVHKANNLGNLNRNQIAQIYTNAAVNNYAQVGGQPGPIHVYSRQPPSGTFDSFLALYITPETASPLLPSCPGAPGLSCITFLDSNDEIAEAVGNDPAGLGYVGVGFLNANGNIRSLPVRKTAADPPVAASFQTVQDGTFAFKRDLFYYTCGVAQPDDLRGRFIDSLMSRAGQSIVAQIGFVPHYFENDVLDHEQALQEPAIARVVKADAAKVAETLVLLASLSLPADANQIAELKSFLHEQFLGDRQIIGNIVDRAVACGADPADIAAALAAIADAKAAADQNPPDWPLANNKLQEALAFAQAALK